jgi:hypothetical protein
MAGISDPGYIGDRYLGDRGEIGGGGDTGGRSDLSGRG